MKKAIAIALSTAALFGGITAPARSQGQTKPTDPQIVKMLIVGAQLEVEYANVALQQSRNEAVRRFAERMVKDHSAVVDSTKSLSARLNITSADSDISRRLEMGGVANEAKLHSLTGPAFDSFYIDNEVRFHKLVIDTTKGVLAPSAENPELKMAVQSWLPMYERHQQHALMLQAENSHLPVGESAVTPR